MSESITIDLNANPFLPDGWKVEKHIKGGEFAFDPARVELYTRGALVEDMYFRNEELFEKFTSMCSYFNATLLDWYLVNTHHIPEDWKGNMILFWGTLYRRADHFLCIRCLYWNRGRWDWDYCLIGNGGFPGQFPAPVRV